MSTPTLSALLRSSQAYYERLSEKTTLQWGIAYTSQRFALLGSANQFREIITEDANWDESFAAVEAFFAERGLTCHRWAPAIDQRTDELQAFLSAKGFKACELTALGLPDWPEAKVTENVRVLPARAMRKALGAVSAERFAELEEASQTMAVEAAEQRLDDAHMDGFVAMVDNRPAGVCALFQTGDIARITDLFVLPALRRQGVGAALMDHAIKLSRRLAMRVTCMQVPSDNLVALELAKRMGMIPDGTTVRYVAPGSDAALD